MKLHPVLIGPMSAWRDLKYLKQKWVILMYYLLSYQAVLGNKSDCFSIHPLQVVNVRQTMGSYFLVRSSDPVCE